MVSNPRTDAILAVAQRYGYEATHAHQVECLAATLFLELEPLHHLGREERRLLEHAAVLHDIGYFVTARGHHRHALQMIMLESLPEFSRDEKAIIANLARYHRKALPSIEHTAYAILPLADRQKVNLLAPLLRIADALDRSHKGLVKELTCKISSNSVVIEVAASGSLETEKAAFVRKADMFQSVYQREAILQTRLLNAEIGKSLGTEAALR